MKILYIINIMILFFPRNIKQNKLNINSINNNDENKILFLIFK